jgi:phosphatidylserine/phosphatidylglycerophosphate/cardiolipin synthase-like enzyme
LAEKLIKRAEVDVLVTSPFVERCHISNSLISAISNGVRVRLVTHNPKFDRYNQQQREKYHSKLRKKGVLITYENSVHAKLIVIDRAVAIVSSMNFLASSSGGASYEAGLVTIEPNVVQSVYRSINNKLLT